MDTATDTLVTPISVTALRKHLGAASAPLVLDVRRQAAFDADPRMLAGALWRDPFTIDDWLKFLPRHRAIVTYCVHGHEISRNAASAIAAAGMQVQYLDGGIEAWNAIDAPCITKQADVGVPSAPNHPTLWITRERPKIDRIACPWLIRRFIDPLAEFRYVPASEVLTEAARTGAIAYDVPNVRFSHRGADGARCSFDALIDDFAINDDALAHVAKIVRGADTDALALTPQSAGLLAISLGLSKCHADDHAMLQQGMLIYDALYAWARGAVDEIHNAAMFAGTDKTTAAAA
jgi:rhodanese-related sulfurtransferase